MNLNQKSIIATIIAVDPIDATNEKQAWIFRFSDIDHKKQYEKIVIEGTKSAIIINSLLGVNAKAKDAVKALGLKAQLVVEDGKIRYVNEINQITNKVVFKPHAAKNDVVTLDQFVNSLDGLPSDEDSQRRKNLSKFEALSTIDQSLAINVYNALKLTLVGSF